MPKKKTTKLKSGEWIGERFEPIPVTPRSSWRRRSMRALGVSMRRSSVSSTISPRRLGVEIVREMIRLRRLLSGEDPNRDFAEDFVNLGFNEAARTYRRNTPFETIIASADEQFTPVMGRLVPALMDRFAGTAKGEIRHFLAVRQRTEEHLV